jgi:phage minor structural protein
VNYPIVFDKFETDFTKLGLAVLENANNVKIHEVINGEYILSFILPPTDPKRAYLQEENFVLVEGQLFRMRTFDDNTDNSGKLTSNVQAEHVWYDSNDCKHIPNFEMIGATPRAILETAFSGTRFVIGVVDASLANTDIELSKTNPAAIVNKLIENIGGEIERNNWTIGLRARVGNDNGVQFRCGKNLSVVKKTTDSRGLITRLYPYGMDDLEITSVNGGIAYLDSPLINNYDYIHQSPRDYRDIDDPAELKTKALTEFSTSEKDGIDKPKVTLQIDIVELKMLIGHSFETFVLGDTIRTFVEDLNIDITARIMEYDYYPYEPKKSNVVLANFKDNAGRLIVNLSATRNQVNNMTTPAGKVKAAWLENIIAQLQTEIQEGMTKKVVSHDYGDIWVDNIENPTKAMAIVNGIFAIANSKKANGDWDWRTFGNGEGFTADLINAGKIHAENIETSELVVGQNITFGLTATDIGAKPYDWMPSYGDISGLKPSVDADNTLGVIGADRLTYIDANGIYTGTLTAQQINAIQGITLGANATIQWALLPNLPTASQIGALPSDTIIPDDNYITTITRNTVSTAYVNALNVTAASVIAGWVYAGNISANQITSGSISADRISGGTLSGVTINISTDATVGDTLHVGGAYQYIEIYNDSGEGYLRTSAVNAIKFFDSGELFTGKGVAINSGNYIGCHLGLTGSTKYNLIKLETTLITMLEPVTFSDTVNFGNYGAAGLKLSDSLDANGFGIENLLSITSNNSISITTSGFGDTISLNSYGNLNLLSSNGRIVLTPYTTSGVQLNGYLAFFGGTPVAKTSITDPSTIYTGSAPSTWSQTWGGNVKTDLDNLRTTLYNLINALQSYSLV